jgi:DNA-binding transcriptional MerR regulator
MNNGRPQSISLGQTELIRIGAFIQLTQLSRKALRLYEQLEILTPAYIDPDSGYRFYVMDQIDLARTIRLMRDAEMPLATIQNVLRAHSQVEAENIVLAYQRQVEQHAQRIQESTHRVLTYLRHEEQQMSFEVEFKQVPAQQVVSIKKRITIDKMQTFIPESINALKAHIEKQGLQISGEVMGLYEGPVNEKDDGPLEIAFPVTGDAKPEGKIKVRQIPAHKGAYVIAGKEYYDFPKVLQVWDTVIDWIRQNGYGGQECTVTSYEVWHKDELEVVWPFEE